MNSSDHSLSKLATDAAPSETTTIMRDLVCGMTVDPAKTGHHTTHDGAHFHFCSAGCLAKFTENPTKYLANRPLIGR